MKKVNNWQITKVQPQGISYHLLDFLPISAWCCLYLFADKLQLFFKDQLV